MSILFGLFAAFSITICLIFLLKPFALKVDLVDRPDSRKHHEGEIPLIGGLAIFMGFVGALAVSGLITQIQSVGIILAGLILVATGLFDDYRSLSFRIKLVPQITAALIMVHLGGIYLQDLGGLSLDGSLFSLGDLAVPFTVFAAVGVINAINMSDGIDGLSGSLTLVALLGLSAVSFVHAREFELTTLLLLSSCVVGFLAFNISLPRRPKAVVFLGDVGSMFLGFVLAWFLIGLSQGESRAMSPVTALWFLAMPLFDTVGVMLRRILKKQSPFLADREHFHHILLRGGYTVFQTHLIITSLALSFMAVGIFSSFYQISDLVMFGAFLGLFGLYFAGMMHAWKVMKFLRRNHNVVRFEVILRGLGENDCRPSDETGHDCSGQAKPDTSLNLFSNPIGDRSPFEVCNLSRL
ncbi:MAG: undecaprenyl/decaprenyl-phosphate alpha-N-acetylglucosaminyl 1-phosphate transferase [Gammaproteobacteria bacterium]|nr:undecaprenyl/decaprenyl-phosphate alpha-N-acetylglucosaminyl 1-phosphate transferase [Gammaproteobacteria bacterium]MDH5799273.1 undecaprenyl/decaprenyl-phosphate alpha-N-acetylglucosaminyl 1-phosphate transferase [Gammaproteobacteria bacterium]